MSVLLEYLCFTCYAHIIPLSESAAILEAESGYTMESSEVSEFRQCILDGAWDSAEAALMRLGVADDDGLWVSVLFMVSAGRCTHW